MTSRVMSDAHLHFPVRLGPCLATVGIGLPAVRIGSVWLARIGLLNLGLSDLPALVTVATGLDRLGPILIERYASTIGWLKTPLPGQHY